MKFLILFLCFVCAQAQIKTAGIKTHYPASGNLVAANHSESHWSSSSVYNSQPSYPYQYNGFVPAQTYQGETFVPHQPVVIVDPIALFINKTRSEMASGVCHKEVETSSLTGNTHEVGNGTTPGFSKIQVCCDGYERNPHIFARCDPICSDGCRNGICTAPETCVCIPGHVRTSDNKCVTTCPLGCSNGICSDNNECLCNAGFVLEPKEKKYCQPICVNDCKFGKCIGPNQCSCDEGYQLNSFGSCEPKCENGCGNGNCTAPGVCACEKGYEFKEGSCVPVCTLGCGKNSCIAPETCSFHKSENISIPTCSDECYNGYCRSSAACSCKPGFQKAGIKGRVSCIPA